MMSQSQALASLTLIAGKLGWEIQQGALPLGKRYRLALPLSMWVILCRHWL